MDLATIFADNVQRILTKRGMQRQELAARLGVTKAAVTHILSGRSPQLATIERVATALETTPQKLLKKSPVRS